MRNKILASMRKEASEFMKDPKKKMREWWGNWWEFMKDPKKKMREWWDKWWEFMKDSKKEMRELWENFKLKHPWKACSLQYGGLALFVFLLGHIFFGILSGMTNVDYFRYPLSETFRHPFNLSVNLTINRTPIMQGTEIYAAEMYADNARSILCTLVGSEAAIVAIVVSLTLIAIEFTASEYSPRVIDISLKNPDMWFLLLIYGVAIFSSIILLKQLPYESRFPTEDVSLAFWFGLFSYVALLPYLRNTIRLFDPTNIVRRVSEDIVKDNILTYINDPESEKVKNNKENPIQPILDITYRSINKYDLETVRKGLEKIVTHANKVIASSKEKPMSFSKYFCDPLRRISRLAASKDDEESTREVIKTLQTFGEKTADKQLIVATEQVAVTLGAVGKISAGKGKAFEDAVKDVASSLEIIGKTAAKKKLNEAVKLVALTLGDVGAFYAEKGKELEDAVEQTATSLKEVGVTAATEVLETATTEVAKALKEVGVPAAEKKLKNATKKAVTALRMVEKAGEKSKLKIATVDAVKSLKAVGEASAKSEELKEVTLSAILGLTFVEKAAVEPDLEYAVTEAVSALKDVGKATIERELEAETKRAVRGLMKFGETSAEKNLENVLTRVVKSLVELSRSNNNVENMIFEYGSKKQDSVGIQELIRLYKHEKKKQKASE